jgi:hypothetical protein
MQGARKMAVYGMHHCRWLAMLSYALVMSAVPKSAAANSEVFRCEGRPSMYTTDVRIAKARGCSQLSEARSEPRRAGVASVAASRDGARQAAEPVAVINRAGTSLFVSTQTQKNRDTGRREILMQELRDEQAKADQLKSALASAGQAGANRAQLQQSLERVESNLTALQKELQFIPL